jgi:hypothetical protein
VGSKFSEEISGGSRKKVNQENSTLGLEAVEPEESAEKEMMDNAGKKRKAGHRTKSKPQYQHTKMRASHWFCYR